MPSPFPDQLDVFSDTPYTDNIQYILSAYANAWINAILALEKLISTGVGNTPGNPRYSQAFGLTFNTLADRFNNVEVSAAGQLVLDTNVNDVQPVGATSSIGSIIGKTLAPDHVHQGVSSYMGRHGAVTTQPGDVFSLFLHQGDLLVGTGAGTGEIFPGPPAGPGYTIVGGATGDPSGLQWQQALWQPGDIKPTTAFLTTPPTGWVIANGQPILRSSPNDKLFAATTISTTGSLTVGGQTGTPITGLTTPVTALLFPGCPVEAQGVPLGTTVLTVSSTQVTLSIPSGGQIGAPGGSLSIRFLPYGQGDGSTTFNVIDMRGATAIGAGQGVGLSNRIPGQSVGGTEMTTMSVSQLPTHSHVFNEPQHSHANNLATSQPNMDHIHETIGGGFTPPATYPNVFGYQYMVAYPFSTVNFEWGPPGGGRIPITVTPAQQAPGTVPVEQWGQTPVNAVTSGQEGVPNTGTNGWHQHSFSDNLARTGATVGNAVDASNNPAVGQPVTNMQPSVVLQYLVKI